MGKCVGKLLSGICAGTTLLEGWLLTARAGDYYIGTYNTLARMLSDRCLAVGISTNDIPLIDPATGELNQSHLNKLRTKVLTLVDTYYLVPPEFFALDKASSSEAFYSSRSRLMAEIGDGHKFTKVPGEYTSDGVPIYAESFTDVPPLWIHFAELHQVMQRLRFTLRTCVWTNYDGSSRYDNGQGCTWQSASTWNQAKTLADLAYANDEPVVAQGSPRSITRGRLSGSTVYYADRSHAFFFAKAANVPTVCRRRAYFYNYATKPDPAWAGGFPLYQEFSNAGEPCVMENRWTLWDLTEEVTTPDIYSIALGQMAFAEWCSQPDVARRFSHSGYLVSDKRAVIEWLFDTPSIMDPNNWDSTCDGVTEDNCECGSCLPSPQVYWRGMGLDVSTAVILGRSNRQLTAGLQLIALLNEYTGGTVRQMHNLDTRVIARAADAGGKWEFVQVKRPSGAEIVFSLKGSKAGWPVGLNKPYRLVKNAGDYELHFGGPRQVVHRFDGVTLALKQIRAVLEHQEVRVDGTPDAWPGLTVYRNAGRVDRIDWPAGTTEISYDQRGNISSITYRDHSGLTLRRITIEGEGERRYQVFSAQNELVDEVRLVSSGPFQREIRRGIAADGEPLWTQKREAFESGAGNIESVWETTTLRGSPTWAMRQSVTHYLFDTFPWGSELIARVAAADSDDPQSTTWHYYTDPLDAANYGRVKLVERPEGGWTRYEYDSQGRTKTVIESFKNATPNDGPEQCRVTRYYYAADPVLSTLRFPANDRTLPNDWRPRLVVTEVLGREVARAYDAYLIDCHVNQRCLDANAPYGASNNIVTVIGTYTNGLHTGRPRQIVHPDGAVSLYEYHYDSFQQTMTGICRRGESNENGVTNGVETVRVFGPEGELLSELQRDITSCIAFVHFEYTYDAFGRETLVSNVLNGLWRQTRYGCCNPELTIDEEGFETWLTYDALGRHLSSTRLGKTEHYLHDVFGNTVEIRKTSSDDLSSVIRFVFDPANRLSLSSNELGGVTRYAYTVGPEGEQIVTATLPNGGVVVETKYRDGQRKSVAGSGAFPVVWDYGADDSGLYTIQYWGADTNAVEWVRTHYDRLGRMRREIYPDGYIRCFDYDADGRPIEESDGFSTWLTRYDCVGNWFHETLDMEGNRHVDVEGSDRITETFTTYKQVNGLNVREVQRWIYPTLGSNERTLAEVWRSSLDNLQLWQSIFGRTNHSVVVYDRQNGRRIETITEAVGTVTVNTYSNGLMVQTRAVSDTGDTIWEKALAYDGFGRLRCVRETAANGEERTISYAYDSADHTTNVTIRVGTELKVLAYAYDSMGWLRRRILPDGSVVQYEYDLRGNRIAESGGPLYPVRFEYDDRGRLTSLSTYRNGLSGEPDTTRWSYDSRRGWLRSKTYPDGAQVHYSYRPDGLPVSRRWARGILTEYQYDGAGAVTNVTYSDATSGVIYHYDRMGFIREVQNQTGKITYTYHPDGTVASATCGHIPGLKWECARDAYGRASRVSLRLTDQPLIELSYHYDPANRLVTISNQYATIRYRYGTNGTALAETTTHTSCGEAVAISRKYDGFDRLSEITTTGPAGLLESFRYHYDTVDRRIEVSFADGSRWRYSYDGLGQLEQARKYHADGELVGGGQFSYQYDSAGNRVRMRNHHAANAAARSYSVNHLNQYTSISNPGQIWVTGEAENNSTIAVGTPGASWAISSRHGEFFSKLLQVDNNAGAVWATVVVRGMKQVGGQNLVRSVTREAFVPPAFQQFQYDADGNLVSDGVFALGWDAEDRLVEVSSLPGIPEGRGVRYQFAYDHMGRCTAKVLSGFTNGQWVVRSSSKYVYDGDGWQPILEVCAGESGSFTNCYVWGIDVSGAVGAGGGIGGLAAICRLCAGAGSALVAIPCYDGNGNVVRVVDSTGTNSFGVYEYGPFGEPLRAVEVEGFSNSFRFGTKRQEVEIGLYNFGYRYYSPQLGRWLSRDPAGEDAERNLYCYVQNDPIDLRDPYGLWKDHNQLTKETFDGLNLPTTDTCRERIMQIIIKANVAQDSLSGPLWENERHFNRSPFGVSKEKGLSLYYVYLTREEQLLRGSVLGATREKCKHALETLGRMVHAWQDFFAHAYHPEFGWDAWQKDSGGTPEKPNKLYPSSYPGRHPPFWEPIRPGTVEYDLRRQASRTYVRQKLKEYLGMWLGNEMCREACENACSF